MLNRILVVACVAILSLVVAGCDSKPDHESVAKDMIGTMKEMVAILKDVKDEESARAAKPKMEAVKKEMEAMKAEADKLPEPTAEQEKRLKEKFEPEIEKLTAEMGVEAERIGNDPKISSALQDLL